MKKLIFHVDAGTKTCDACIFQLGSPNTKPTCALFERVNEVVDGKVQRNGICLSGSRRARTRPWRVDPRKA